MEIAATSVLAIRDALIRGNVQEAYHELRMAVDGDCTIALETGEHWTAVEAEAALFGPTEPKG